MTAQALQHVLALPGVQDAVTGARDACTQLRWHRALRRRTEQARAEATVRAARAGAVLAGSRWPVEAFRDAARGADRFPLDAAGRTAQGVLRALAEAEHLEATWPRAPLQALARLHVAAVAGLVDDAALGRPRSGDERPGDGQDLALPDGSPLPAPIGPALDARLSALSQLLTTGRDGSALVLAALAHAEVATVRPFVTGNGVVARALCRSIVISRALDPTGVAVWEAGLLALGPSYPRGLSGYALGGADGVGQWVRTFAEAVVLGAQEGTAVCDAVLAGRLPAS